MLCALIMVRLDTLAQLAKDPKCVSSVEALNI